MIFSDPLNPKRLEVGDYVQSISIPEAFGIVIHIDSKYKRAAVCWNIPGLDEDEDTTTHTYISMLRLIFKPANC